MDGTSLLTIEQAGEKLGLKRSKVYELIAQDELPSVKIGKSRRIPAKLLEQYVERLIAEQCNAA